MNISLMAFLVCSVAAGIVFAALALKEPGAELIGFKRSGATTIGRNSITWLGGLALALAIFICFFLV